MPSCENYLKSDGKMEQWLTELRPYIRHTDIDPDHFSQSALIVIDMQNYFLDERSHAFLPSGSTIMPNINALIRSYSGSGKLVIFTRHADTEKKGTGEMASWWRDAVRDDTRESMLADALIVPEDSPVIRKNTYDAFHNTPLKESLDKKGIRTVVITGVMTHLCCETTAREAFVNDYHVYVPIDATATTNAELHRSSLRTLGDGFARLCLTKDLIDILNAGNAGRLR